jgi:hypothetical protein
MDKKEKLKYEEIMKMLDLMQKELDKVLETQDTESLAKGESPDGEK